MLCRGGPVQGAIAGCFSAKESAALIDLKLFEEIASKYWNLYSKLSARLVILATLTYLETVLSMVRLSSKLNPFLNCKGLGQNPYTPIQKLY